MANGRNKLRKIVSGRDQGGFVAFPWSVIDSAAYQSLSHPARSLLIEVARQFVRDNNGRLLTSMAHLSRRGWKSADVITRAKRELLSAGFIHETVTGQRPNKASWYAMTWQALDRLDGYDTGAAACFERGAYRTGGAAKNTTLKPQAGVDVTSIAPCHGVDDACPTPPGGAVMPVSLASPTPSHGNHLEMPSAATNANGHHVEATSH